MTQHGNEPAPRRARLGWSRTTVELAPDAIVLDVGCGAWPNEAATIACDRSVEEDRHRTGRATTIDRPFVLCDAARLPFRDGSVDFVIASHIAEHVDEPETFCAELARVAVAGYIETPSPLADYLLDEEYHQWRVGGSGSAIEFRRKAPKPRVVRWFTDRVYRVFYAGRDTGTPTYRLPRGPIGRLLGAVLYVIRGVLNRSGVMHTRIGFSAESPLRWTVDRSAAMPRRVAVIERGPRSGFIEGDRAAIEQTAAVRVVRYPGWPSPGFVWRTWRAAGWADAVYTFFASEQAVVAAIVARVRRRRFVVCVGGYDVADERRHGYGLPTRWTTRWVPWIVLRLSHRVIAMSTAARDEALRAGSPPERTVVSHLGLTPRFGDAPATVARDADTVVTVAYVDEVSWSRKGIDRFVDAARRDPTRRYVLVGRIAEPIRTGPLADPPANLVLTGYVDDDELNELLWSAGSYAQFSWHEGYGVSMVEAMQAGCLPVISDIPTLREVAGPSAVRSAGPDDDPAAIARASASTIDRAELSAWAASISCPRARATALEDALFGVS